MHASLQADPGYSRRDQLLHRLALEYRYVADLLFDLDQIAVRRSPAGIVQQRHVFIAGLARAGTTMLTQRFHSTRRYRSLTYRDMPFVLAPNLWRRLSRLSPRQTELTERAHGDKVLVGVDSPESLDEVFWRVFSGKEYICADGLRPHTPDQRLIEKYVHYVNAILKADGSSDRYLSKNNNNILRLGAIHRAFPGALILVPFREPLQHACSLFRQHIRFSEIQARRPFALTYMTWLGHHEFGLGHRPFRFDNSAPERSADTLEYWVHLWCDVYSWIASTMPQSAVFLCYEDFCGDRKIWGKLAELANVPEIEAVGESTEAVKHTIDRILDKALVQRAEALYSRLQADARHRLS